ncbi:putative oxidoreductase, chloroplastic, partial [Cucurbita argyrosperma subsp. sororia]
MKNSRPTFSSYDSSFRRILRYFQPLIGSSIASIRLSLNFVFAVAMAVQLSYACFSFLPMNRSRIYRPKAVASEDYGTLTSQEEKVKLGGSELKVTRLGIGAWSWGDNSYWNNFEWDGMMKAAKAAFGCRVLTVACTFVDTAEVYCLIVRVRCYKFRQLF